MIWFGTTRPSKPVTLTGVSGELTALHRGPHGDIHGHTWLIRAWFPNSRTHDGEFLRTQLDHITAHWAGKCLPDNISRGEDLAAHIGQQLTDDYYGHQCVLVEIDRPDERIYARWER